MVALPAEILYGTITAQLFTAEVDAADVDHLPEGVAIIGTATFKPAASALRDAIGKAIILPKPMTYAFNGLGQLVSPDGTVGVSLIASDSPSVQPLNFSYNVSFALVGTSLAGFNFYLPAGTTLDLAELIQVNADYGQFSAVGPQGPEGPDGPQGPGLIDIGDDETVARPAGIAEAVIWAGSVRPLNFLDGDLYLETVLSEPEVDWLAAYNAADVAGIDASRIASWPDASGNGFTLVQATTGKKPYLVVPGGGAPNLVHCDGGNCMAVAWGSLKPQPMTYIFVVAHAWPDPVGTQSVTLGDGIDSTNRNNVHPSILATVPARSVLAASAGGNLYTPGSFTDLTSHMRIVEVVFNGVNSSITIDGAQMSIGDPGAQGVNGLTIGLPYTQVGALLASDYYAIRVADGLLDETTRGKIRAFFAYQLGIELAAG